MLASRTNRLQREDTRKTPSNLEFRDGLARYRRVKHLSDQNNK